MTALDAAKALDLAAGDRGGKRSSINRIDLEPTPETAAPAKPSGGFSSLRMFGRSKAAKQAAKGRAPKSRRESMGRRLSLDGRRLSISGLRRNSALALSSLVEGEAEGGEGQRSKAMDNRLTLSQWLELMAHAERRKYARGECVMAEGSTVRALCQVSHGSIRVEKRLDGGDAAAVVVGRLQSGDFFGQVRTRALSARASLDVSHASLGTPRASHPLLLHRSAHCSSAACATPIWSSNRRVPPSSCCLSRCAPQAPMTFAHLLSPLDTTVRSGRGTIRSRPRPRLLPMFGRCSPSCSSPRR